MQLDIVRFISTNREALDLIIDLLPIPVFVKDRSGRYIDCNTAFNAFLSFNREQVIGKTVHEIWSKAEADVFFAQDQELLDRGGLQVYEGNITSSDGSQHIVQFHKQTFSDSSHSVAGFLGVIFDITEKKRLELALANLAATDELTGLPNRRDGMGRLEALHNQSKRKDRPYCLAMIDLDHFKSINDQHGHANGDLVLKFFAAVVRKMLRVSDICFRFGGEEFVVLLPETTMDEGIKVIERLRETWATTVLSLSDGQTLHLTISAGLTQYSMNSTSQEDLIQASDNALYAAKSSGRNRTVCSPPG